MTTEFILISTQIGKRKYEIYEQLTKIPEIKELHPITGEYNLIAKVDNNIPSFTNITDKIKNIKGITKIHHIGIIVNP